MTASFKLTLDTTAAVTARINGGAGSTPNELVVLELDLEPDAAEVKIWGSVNTDNPLNAGLALDEASASWLTPTAAREVALSEGQGSKTLFVKVRDDVLNVGTASATIVVGTPTELPTVPLRPGGEPARRRQRVRQRKTIEDRSRVRVSSAGRHAAHLIAGSNVTASSTARVIVAGAARSLVRTATRGSAVVKLGDGSRVEIDIAYQLRKSTGDEMESIIAALL